MTDAGPSRFTMVGDPAAAACEGDACLIPGTTEAQATEAQATEAQTTRVQSGEGNPA